MTNREVHLFDGGKQTSLAAAQAVVSLAAQAMEARGHFVVALSGGEHAARLVPGPHEI